MPTNPFQPPARTGTVLGVGVRALPVPYGLVRALAAAEDSADDTARLAALAETVRQCVTLADGTPLDPDTLDVPTIGALFAFAVAPRPAADFTSPASPVGAAGTPTPSPSTS